MTRLKNKTTKHEDFFIEYCESFIYGTDRICSLCELQGTHCEGSMCDDSYDSYLLDIINKEAMKDIRSDFYFRNKYNSMSIKSKIGFKKYLN